MKPSRKKGSCSSRASGSRLAPCLGREPRPAHEPVELIILVGIPASGKTTYFRRHLARRYAHVSLDNWRGKGNARGKEREAIIAALHAAAGADTGEPPRGVVVDNTNVTAETRRRYFQLARAFQEQTGRTVKLIAYFFDVPLEDCLRRNERRPRNPPIGEPYHVPPAAIHRFQAQLEPPSGAEGFDEVLRVRIAPDGRFRVREQQR